MRIFVGVLLMIIGWSVINTVFNPLPLSREFMIIFAGVTFVTLGAIIVDAARVGVWPWDRS